MLLKEECFKDGIYKEPGKEKEQEGSFLLSTIQRRGPPTGADWGTLRKQHIMRQG